jgi:RND family efflux transporter MFP subunit
VRHREPARRARAARAAWAAGALMGALAVSATGCRRDSVSEEVPGSGAPRRVRCAPAQLRELRAQVLLHGTVAPLPDRDAQIAPQVAGRIVAVLVREGDPVTRGQPLARIDDAALSDQVKEANAQLAKAQAEAGLARTTRARVERVVERGIAARQELDDADARLATAQAGEDEARAASGIVRRQLERSTVRSPLRGVVLKLFRRSGELVDGTPATPIVEVGDPAHLELVASATAAQLVRIHARDAAAIEVPALPGSSLRGTVAAVSPAVDRVTGLGSVRISLDPGAGAPPPVGVSGVVRIQTGAPHRATLVPAAALRAAAAQNGESGESAGGDHQRNADADAEVVVCGPDRKAHVVRVRRVQRLSDGGDDLAGMTEVRAAGDAGGLAIAAGTAIAVDPVLGWADGDPIEPAPP